MFTFLSCFFCPCCYEKKWLTCNQKFRNIREMNKDTSKSTNKRNETLFEGDKMFRDSKVWNFQKLVGSEEHAYLNNSKNSRSAFPLHFTFLWKSWFMWFSIALIKFSSYFFSSFFSLFFICFCSALCLFFCFFCFYFLSFYFFFR